MMHPALPFALGALALSACAPTLGPLPRGPIVLDRVSYDVAKRSSGAVQVQRIGKPFANWEGAEARRAADEFCNGRANTGVNDRFLGDIWLIPGGCV